MRHTLTLFTALLLAPLAALHAADALKEEPKAEPGKLSMIRQRSM